MLYLLPTLSCPSSSPLLLLFSFFFCFSFDRSISGYRLIPSFFLSQNFTLYPCRSIERWNPAIKFQFYDIATLISILFPRLFYVPPFTIPFFIGSVKFIPYFNFLSTPSSILYRTFFFFWDSPPSAINISPSTFIFLSSFLETLARSIYHSSFPPVIFIQRLNYPFPGSWGSKEVIEGWNPSFNEPFTKYRSSLCGNSFNPCIVETAQFSFFFFFVEF